MGQKLTQVAVLCVGGAVAVGTMLWGMKKKWISNGLKTGITGLSFSVSLGYVLFVHQAVLAQKAAIAAVREYLESEINPQYLSAAGIEWCLIEDHGQLGDDDWYHIVIKCHPQRARSVSPSSGPNSCDLHWARIHGRASTDDKNRPKKDNGLPKIQE